MSVLNTAIRGAQIATAVAGNGLTKDGSDNLALDLNELTSVAIDVTADEIAIVDATDASTKKESIADLATAMAGNGLSATSGAFALDLNELSGAVVDVSADSIPFVDATDSSSKLESIADLATGMAGDGLSASSGALALDLNELTGAVIDVSADSIPFLDATDSSSKIESVADFVGLIAGNGIASASGVLSLDLNELSSVAVDVSADSIAILDATDSSSKLESIADLATAMAGTGITATNGVLSADSITDNIVEGDLNKEDESANCNGVTTVFNLTNIPLADSVQVFLNGLYQQEGSGKDYTLDAGAQTVTFTTAPATGDILVIFYITNN